MPESGTNPMHRREFIQAGAAATAAVTLTPGAGAAQVGGDKAGAANKKTELPRRVLGKTGAEVTIVNAGTWRAPDSLDRLLRHSFLRGVRYFDTAAGYHTEDRFKAWFAAQPEVRKQIFLATKDHVREPGQMVKTGRPAAGGARNRLYRFALFPRRWAAIRSTGPRARK